MLPHLEKHKKKKEWKKAKVLKLLLSLSSQTENLDVVYTDPCIFHLWLKLGVLFYTYRECLALCSLFFVYS